MSMQKAFKTLKKKFEEKELKSFTVKKFEDLCIIHLFKSLTL